MFSGFSCGDNPNNFVVFFIYMNHDEQFCFGTHTKKNESILIIRVVWVGNESRRIVIKYGFSLLKGDTMFFLIGLVFRIIPNENHSTMLL